MPLSPKAIFLKEYLVEWKGLSYLHCTWVSEREFVKAYKPLPRLRTKVNNFHRQMSSINNSEDEFVAIRPEWTTVDWILACRFNHLNLIDKLVLMVLNSSSLNDLFLPSQQLNLSQTLCLLNL